jgi:hypothetical protein
MIVYKVKEVSKTLGQTSRVNTVQESRANCSGVHSPEIIVLLSLGAK